MSVETSASNGMKYATNITDTIVMELFKALCLRQEAEKRLLSRLESAESGKMGYRTLLEQRDKELKELAMEMKSMKDASPEERDLASCMTGEFRKEYRAEIESEIRKAGFVSFDISDCFQPLAETEDEELKEYVTEERDRTGSSPYMRLYHFHSNEEDRNAVNKIADLYNEYDKSLMHKTHRVKESDFSIENADSSRSRITTISGLRAEEALLLGKLIERRSREADIIELGRQDPDLAPYYMNRQIPERIIGDYSLEPTGKDANGVKTYSLTCSENDHEAAIGMLAETKITLATPYASPYLEMYRLESEELDKINKGIDAGKEFTVVDVNNASHILRVYKDGYSEISKDEEGKTIKKDYELKDPMELKNSVRDILNTMTHPFQMDKKDIKPKDIIVNEEYQERITAFASLEVKTDDAYQYSPKNFTRQFKVEITEEGGIRLDAPEHVMPPVIAAEDLEMYKKNEKIRQFIAQGLDPSEAKAVGDELDQYEFERYSSYYHPEDEKEEDKKELSKEDKDTLFDIFAASCANIAVISRFPEKQREEEHSIGSMLQKSRDDLGEGFGEPGFDHAD